MLTADTAGRGSTGRPPGGQREDEKNIMGCPFESPIYYTHLILFT